MCIVLESRHTPVVEFVGFRLYNHGKLRDSVGGELPGDSTIVIKCSKSWVIQYRAPVNDKMNGSFGRLGFLFGREGAFYANFSVTAN